MRTSRRAALRAMMGAALAACASPADEEEADQTEDDLKVCFGLDKHADETQAGAPAPFQKIEKVVVLMMENRSFDHYFGHLSMPAELGGEGRTDVDGLTGKETQPDLDGRQIPIWNASGVPIGDIDHSWDACHEQFANGMMDGFVRSHQARMGAYGANSPIRSRLPDPMAILARKDTPVLHALADEYALCDRWFSSVMGPTWPNRFYLHAATSNGRKTNKPVSGAKLNTIWEALHAKCISAVNYYGDVPWAIGGFQMLPQNENFINRKQGAARIFEGSPFSPLEGPNGLLPDWAKSAIAHQTFERRCREGTLPAFSIVDPSFFTSPNDDHPPHDVAAGQAFIGAIYKLVTMNEEQWKKTLFVVTYDEHGSFYDHVKPPVAAGEADSEFAQLGFRVPSIVIAPWVKRGKVIHTPYDHTSILSTVTRRFGLEPLNERVRQANDLRDCFDPELLEGAARSPAQLAKIDVSESAAHASIADSLGQEELGQQLGYVDGFSREKKRVATDHYLGALDRLGVARVTT